MDETYIPVTEPVPMSPKERFSRMGVALLLIAAAVVVLLLVRKKKARQD